MEFILHLPQEINKDGTLWQTWDSFYRKCQLYQNTDLHGAALGDSSSLLLFAGSHHINSICSSLKVYNLNLEKLTKVLHVVEQACLPYFILLFERFRYFSLKRDLSSSLDDNAIILQKQAEMCEFIDSIDSMRTKALCSSQKTESKAQCSNADRLYCYSKDVYIGAESSYSNIRDNNPVRFETPAGDVDMEMSNQSRSSRSSQDTDICTSVDFNSHAVNADSSLFHTEKDKYNTFSTDEKNVGSKLTGMRSKWEVGKRVKFNRAQKTKDVRTGNTKKGVTVTSLEKSHWTGEAASTCDRKMGTDGSKVTTSVTSTIVVGTSINLKQFQCCQCNRVFAGRNCFKKHLFTKHKGCSEFVCRICKATFVDAEKYLVHYTNTHTVEQKIRRARRVPETRIKVKEEVRRFHCTICRKTFHKKGYLNRHVHFSHKQSFLCWHCGEDLQSLPDYKQHSEKHVIVGRFLCDLCQRPYNSIFRLVSHLKNHLLPQNKCEICSIIFMKQESLARHVEKHNDEPAHKCKICGKNFVMQGRLQCHMRTHSGEKRFTCELCGKTYAQKVNLIHHKRWHAGEQPYACEICGKRTRSLGDLNKHKRKHSDKYSYVCEVCGRGFNHSSALLKHRLGHTGKRSYACDVCGRTYIYREGLRDHIKASRCPGRAEAGVKRTPRATKLLLSAVPDAVVDVESKVFDQVPQSTTDVAMKDVQDWHCLLRNNETDGGANVLVPSFY